MSIVVHQPVEFPGTFEEAVANRLTHHFMWDGEDSRCMFCDSRPSHVAASYPCGAEVPRKTVIIPMGA